MENDPIKLMSVDAQATHPETEAVETAAQDEVSVSDMSVSRETSGDLESKEAFESAEAISNENEILIELASQSKGEPRTRSRASIVGTMLLAAGMGMGLVHSEDASAHDQGNILNVFKDQVTRGVNQQIYEAGRDSGGVMGGAARIIIDRTVNAATQRVLEGAGVPAVRAPEQVVVVPRSVENGPAVYTQQRNPSYGEVRYGGGVVVQGGYERGYNPQFANQIRDINARYDTERSRLEIEASSNPEQQQAVKEQQELNLMRLNKSFKDRVDRAQPDERMIVMKEWSAAKSQFLASQRNEAVQGRLAQVEMRRAQEIAAVQIQQRRAQGN